MRRTFSPASRRRLAEERQRKADARACGEPKRPDARAMFLAEGDLLNAQAREAKVRHRKEDAQWEEQERMRLKEREQNEQRAMERLKDQQAEALARGELTPERLAEFREIARLAVPPRPAKQFLVSGTPPFKNAPF